MPNPRAFISFDFDNNEGQKNYFIGQAINSRTPFNIEDWSSKEELKQHEWEEKLEAKIKKCNMVIVLVGKRTNTAEGVIKEINFAKKHDVPFFGIYIDGASTSTTLPYGLERHRVIEWVWNSIANAIEQMTKEGKNK